MSNWQRERRNGCGLGLSELLRQFTKLTVNRGANQDSLVFLFPDSDFANTCEQREIITSKFLINDNRKTTPTHIQLQCHCRQPDK